MAKKKNTTYKAEIDKVPDHKIYLNINHLDKGDYELNILHQKKIIVKTTFCKK
ncbi:MAG: hypothetical protein J0M25_04475 [Flavobacteriales bacterium]|jgi:hypothetical protein|nr:hypothetical protein [Flavobacteriales bacterium]